MSAPQTPVDPPLGIPVTAGNAETVALQCKALADPFDPAEVKWKPQSVKGGRALAMCYIDARLVQDRLDEVLGVEAWQDEYQLLPDGSVVCQLKCRLGGEWITKTDVGGPSEQPDGGDRLKAAFSDALKRAAVKFGVGRYLYRLQAQWVDYDPARKQFAHTPQLPAWALPAGATPPQQRPPRQPPGSTANRKSAPRLPATGAELLDRIEKYDAKLAGAGTIRAGRLTDYVRAAGAKAGYGEDLAKWSGPAIPFAVECVKSFEDALRKQQQQPAGAA